MTTPADLVSGRQVGVAVRTVADAAVHGCGGARRATVHGDPRRRAARVDLPVPDVAEPHHPTHSPDETADVAKRFADAVTAIWQGWVEVDRFNELVLRAGFTWQQVVILRAYAKYLRQAGFPYSQAHIETVINDNAGTARSLVELFEACSIPRSVPARPTPTRPSAHRPRPPRWPRTSTRWSAWTPIACCARSPSLIQATLRTNYFVTRPDSARSQGVVAMKLNPGLIDELPLPRPKFEIFVYSPRVEGVHLRFGSVARGGLRWSDRREDFRTEILGLVKAQAVKNAVIVPVGAKGGFVVKNPPLPTGDPATDRDATRNEGVACYRLFIAGLLDVTDNVDRATGAVVPPPEVVRRDGDDAYLVVAADKGTATFSDIANEVAASYGFWLGDAFASGGSVGYDHKAMGITAKGGWESVRRHFREMGVDTQTEDFTVVGIGDMAGDVFGNGMLLSAAHPVDSGVQPHAHLLGPRPGCRVQLGRTATDVRPAALQLGRLRQVADLRGWRRVQPRAEVDPDQSAGARRPGPRRRRHRVDAARSGQSHPQGTRRPAVERRYRHLHQGRDRVGRRRRRPRQRSGSGQRKSGARQGDRRGRQPRRHLVGAGRVRPGRRPDQHRCDGQLRRRRLLRPRGEHQDPGRLTGHPGQGGRRRAHRAAGVDDRRGGRARAG